MMILLRHRLKPLLLGLIGTLSASAEPLSVGQLTTNGRTNPLGIAAGDISFSWATKAEGRGMTQGAYQIRVGTGADGNDVWNPGRVASGRQIDVRLPDDIRLKPATRYYWQVRVEDQNGVESDWSPAAWLETGLLSADDWSGAKWISRPQESAEGGAPLMRKRAELPKEIASARLYASANGLYQLSINGRKVGDQHLAPGWTDYDQRIQSQTYDVTELLGKGKNVIGAALGPGWFTGKVGLGWQQVYGKRLALVAKLQVNYADGTTTTVVSDGSWQCHAGPLVQADLQDGEHYDARLEQAGWDRPGFDASSWKAAEVLEGDLGKLVPQPDEPIRELEVLTAKTRTLPDPGVAIYDLGQNMVGVSRVRMSGKKGQTVRIRHAEELYRLGDQKGRLYTDNFRTAKVIDRYTFGEDGSVIYQPTFTQHGFRYIEISGLDDLPPAEDVQGVVLGSDLPDTGDLRLSDPMLDQLVRNVRWGQRGNFLSIPTDTPARDERLGWTGDISVFGPTACRYQDTRAFLSKWMDDVRDSQRPDGNIPAVVPQPADKFGETGVGWSDAFITVPHAVWESTGDARILRRNWEAMKKFYQFVYRSATQDGNLIEEGRSSWFSGDWLNLEGVDRLQEHRVIATAYFAENTHMMAEMAAVMGEEKLAAEWQALVPKIKAAFVEAFRRPDGSIEMGTQTVYAMAIGMDLITVPSQRAETAKRFVEKLAADDYHLKTGFLGTPWLLPALSKIGRDDLAMRLLLNDSYPSWGFEIGMGATTMWERWNSIRANGEFGPVEMNSFNHYAYGAVADWMFGHLGGIRILEPGYRKSRIAPLARFDRLNESKCRLQTPYGLLSCDWKRDGGRLRYAVDVPANTTAEVVIPVADPVRITEGGKPATATDGLLDFRIEEGRTHFHVGSGHYEFDVSLPND